MEIGKGWVALLALGFSTQGLGCISIAPMETATTVAPGESEHSFGMEILLPESNTGDSGDFLSFGPAYQYRRGLSAKLDAAIRVFFLAGIEVGMRYQILRGPLTIAIGGQLSSSISGENISFLGSDKNDQDNTLFLAQVPMWISYQLSDSLSVMLVPRAAYGNSNTGNGDFGTFYGSSFALPIHFRKGVTLIPNIGVFKFNEGSFIDTGIAVNF